MSSFTKPLDVRYHPSIDRWECLSLFRYYIGEENSDDYEDIEKGMLSDGGSIPPFAWIIVGHPMEIFPQEYFLHDKLYREQKRTRKESDDILLEAMNVRIPTLDISEWKRKSLYVKAQIIHKTLRGFGWNGWNKRKKEILAEKANKPDDSTLEEE